MNILRKASLWIENDPVAITRLEMRRLLAESEKTGDVRELEERLSKTLEFGTAGLRAPQGAGFNRVNAVVTAQAANALSQFLLEENRGRTLVIGYDGRYNSQLWARNTARIASSYDITALIMPRALPTPLLAFAVRQLGAAAGVMVTASHNPREYNGYKVYLGGEDKGAQIPDTAAAKIAKNLRDEVAYSDIPMKDSYGILDEEIIEAYLSRTAKAIKRQFGSPKADLKICHTAMHGVGHEIFVRLMEKLGFHNLVFVEEQKMPDSAFPTLPFPNPEEKGALDLAFETARLAECDIIIANDPDADRVAVAHPDGKVFTGNEIGALLGVEIARMQRGHGVLSNSMVSSPIMRRIAESYGMQHVETPTGFKWVARVPDICFGFEEALGYMIHPELVRDKDGLSAGAAIATIAASQKAQGRSLRDCLDDLQSKLGYFRSTQYVVRMASLDSVQAVMQNLRAESLNKIGRFRVTKYRDLLFGSPPVDLLEFNLGQDIDDLFGRLIVRPSGTELKLKCYIDSVAKTPDGAEQLLSELTYACKNLLCETSRRGGAEN
ncbi:phospho-sugar mutase [Tropheryma whipplei]|uniref:phospho-sugar mutase n=1 Tax=Tropheryma whipplei TaxID=2039 RepID=UPI0004AECD21|nr:phospho-sugar mutase [Tropheryma whipplei]